ncbi:hypothetical protein RHA1_ro08497 (plasmid) [Rhodococcus jostii RHA1]|uniref:Uncharacterized protein n=1 Tax=Rhodococcus jostii (strain RHA1) TaxID=101510 RepID=Q0RYU5_RHOJR|nr:hypothetical protein RHA1_ro08497 [Rhodococcus jostii RHA1]
MFTRTPISLMTARDDYVAGSGGSGQHVFRGCPISRTRRLRASRAPSHARLRLRVAVDSMSRATNAIRDHRVDRSCHICCAAVDVEPSQEAVDFGSE